MFSYCSLGSFIFDSMRFFTLPPDLLCVVENQHGRSHNNVSKAETEWSEWLREQLPPNTLQTAFSSSKGQRRFSSPHGTVIPDAYREDQKVAYFFNG
jgi:hypothetical protein